MINRARHDYIELSFIYVTAIVTLLCLSTIAYPVKTSRFGFIIPQETTQKDSSLYASQAFSSVTVNAKAYVVYDIVDKKIISGKHENDTLPLASITKIMTMITALTHHDTKTSVTIHKESIDGAYDLGLKKNQVWKLGELLKYTLVFSSNDGALAIADGLGGRKAFVKDMNNDATLLGLTTLYFNHPAGLDDGPVLGGEGSALDVAKLFAIARKKYPEILDATTHNRVTVTASTGKIIGIPNTNQEIEELLGTEASKTGFTDSAGGNLAVVVDTTVGHPVVIVVLGSTRDGRFSDIVTLYKALQKSIEPIKQK